MSDVMGRKFYNVDQPVGALFGLVTGGVSFALGPSAIGKDVVSETEGLVVGTGGATTPGGFIAQGGSETVSETVTVTVV